MSSRSWKPLLPLSRTLTLSRSPHSRARTRLYGQHKTAGYKLRDCYYHYRTTAGASQRCCPIRRSLHSKQSKKGPAHRSHLVTSGCVRSTHTVRRPDGRCNCQRQFVLAHRDCQSQQRRALLVCRRLSKKLPFTDRRQLRGAAALEHRTTSNRRPLRAHQFRRRAQECG